MSETAKLVFEIKGPYEPPADDYETYEGEGYTLTGLLDGTTVGRVEMVIVDELEDRATYDVYDAIHVRWVEVEPDFRRQGIGTALLDEARRRWPERELHTNGLTPDGEGLWASFDR